MIMRDDALAQLNALLAECATARAQLPPMGGSPEARTLAQRLLAAIQRFTAPTTSYAQAAAPMVESTINSRMRFSELVAIATALRDDIQNGWLSTVVELTHVDTYADYLDMARGLNDQHHKDAAAVIAGTSLEVHLKALATKQGISLLASNGRPKKASVLNDDLKREDVYNALAHHQVMTGLTLRNHAAHGEYTAYDEANVRALIDDVRDFASRYPA